MATIESATAGSFCWIELATTNQNAAKTFYTNLFGWTVTDNPMGPDEVYSMFKLKGHDSGAAYTLKKEQQAQGVPPHWGLYIAVNSADDAVKNAEKLGGKVLAPAFDVFDVGRMAVLQDPTGAIFQVWQAKASQGISIAGEDNAFCWADLVTTDPLKAEKFYSGLFGWKISKGEHDPSGYLHIKNGEHFIGGVPPASGNSKIPPHWMIYIQAADVAKTVDKAKGLGAKVLMPPQTMEHVGTWAIVADPQGASFALFKSAR
ncbi:MAG TPA: VOC family protein [Candidatus Angelobacter sp.]|nr:VOC family protein [Candidatus Angelobacter sp.]